MNPPVIPLTIKPRKRVNTDTPLIVCDSKGNAFSELTGEFAPIAEMIATHPRAILACTNPLRVLEMCHSEHKNNDAWNFRIIPTVRERFDGKPDPITRNVDIVSFLGFQSPGKKGGRGNRYFYPLSPKQFCRQPLHALVPGDLSEIERLLVWATDVKNFVVENQLRFSPTSGGLAGQLLRDERFYPEPRRKVPTATNERAREALPGNTYVLNANTDVTYTSAIYLDQRNAHHFAAQTVRFPDDKVIAGGWFHSMNGKPWIRAGTETFDNFLERRQGLLYCSVDIPAYGRDKVFIPSSLYKPATGRLMYIFTNEIDYYRSLGVRIKWISAAWTSPTVDKGLARYSEWSERQIALRPDRKPWLKSVLLAGYGLLAAKPRKLQSAYWQSKKGERKRFYVGAREYHLNHIETNKNIQMPTAHVIQRGMIEAETRKISLQTAQHLHDQGFEVLSVYADGIIVRDSNPNKRIQLPPLPRPWRVQGRIRGLRFIDEVSFESDILTKLPGRSKRLREGKPHTTERVRNASNRKTNRTVCRSSGPEGASSRSESGDTVGTVHSARSEERFKVDRAPT